MPATILWATLIAWLLLVGVAIYAAVQDWRARQIDRQADPQA